MANIELIGVQEAEAVWPLSIEAGWNQNIADWRFMLGAGRGFGLKNEGGTWEASSLVLPLGQHLASTPPRITPVTRPMTVRFSFNASATIAFALETRRGCRVTTTSPPRPPSL